MRLKELIIEFDGKDLGKDHLTLLSEVRIQQKLSLPTLCEFAFLVGPNSQLDRHLQIGAKAVVRVATQDASGLLFTGEITAREYVYNSDEGTQIRVRAYDQLHRLRKHQRVASYAEVSLKTLASQLLSDAGVRVSVVTESSVPELTWKRLIQGGQSHFDFLLQQCVAGGVYFTLHNDKFSLLTMHGIGSSVTLVLGHTLLEASFEVNGNETSRTCNAVSWNPRRAELQTGEATHPRVGRKVKAEAPPAKVGGAAIFKMLGGTVEDSSQASALAQAQLDFRSANEVTIRGIAIGSPALRPGTKVRIEDVAAEVAGSYVLTEVTHVMTGEEGYTSEITSQSVQSKIRSQATLAVLGHVSSVDDPELLGRVQVHLPAYEDAETDWMEVVTPGGGKAKGLIAMPNVGDQVLVLCPNENLAHGIVLGGLYGTQPPPDTGVEGGKTQRFTIHTPGGHLVSLDDKKNVLRIQSTQGSYVEFAPSGVVIHSAGKLDLEAPGNSVTITGAKIDFQTG